MEMLKKICQTGRYDVTWENLRNVLAERITEVVKESTKKYPDLKEKETAESHLKPMMKALTDFGDAPFTLQRLCEILVNPEELPDLIHLTFVDASTEQAHYKSTHKLVYALGKLLSVTSTYSRGEGQSSGQADLTESNEMDVAD
eukprot:g3374.t1